MFWGMVGKYAPTFETAYNVMLLVGYALNKKKKCQIKGSNEVNYVLGNDWTKDMPTLRQHKDVMLLVGYAQNKTKKCQNGESNEVNYVWDNACENRCVHF